MKKGIFVVFAILLAGCVTATRLDSGEHTVGKRLVFNLDGAWNKVNIPGSGLAETWTMEGVPIDQLIVFSGLTDGQEVAPSVRTATDTQKQKLLFRSKMQPDEIAAMFEAMLTRDGSAFKLSRLSPVSFGGGRGFRIEYQVTRKVDGAQLAGIGYGVVDRGELFALLYIAPRLTFFPRHQQRVERMALGARIRSS